jgi:hypothetical protein
MRFQDLCVIYESSLKLVKGNYGSTLTAKEYDQGIKNNIASTDKYNYNSIRYFLGKPGIKDSNYITLYYQVTPSGEMPPKYFKYEIPDSTIQRFRTQKEIFNKNKPAFLAGRVNVFYLNGRAVPKFFQEKDLQVVMDMLIKINENFIKSYGKEFSFIGDVYRMGQDTTFSQIAASWERNKQNLKNLPSQFKDYWKNL